MWRRLGSEDTLGSRDTLWAVVWAHWPPRAHRSEVSAVGGWTLNFQEQEAPLPHRELRSQPGDPMLLNPVALSGYRQSSTLQASPRGLHLVSPQWLVTQMYSLDLIWTRVKFWVNLGHDSVGSCFSHHLAVCVPAKILKTRFRLRMWPRPRRFWSPDPAHSFLHCHRELRSQAFSW